MRHCARTLEEHDHDTDEGSHTERFAEKSPPIAQEGRRAVFPSLPHGALNKLRLDLHLQEFNLYG